MSLSNPDQRKPDDEFIICARFGATHGVRGAIKVFSDTEPADKLLEYSPWWVNTKDIWCALKPENARVTPKHLIVTLPNCHDCDEAREYTNKPIAIKRSQFEPLPTGGNYWVDLIDSQVHNEIDNKPLGILIDIFHANELDIFVIETKEKKRILIPNTPNFIIHIDTDNKRIDVRWEPI